MDSNCYSIICINARSVAHCCKSFPSYFSVDTSINRKNIRFKHCLISQEKKQLQFGEMFNHWNVLRLVIHRLRHVSVRLHITEWN